jgi:predicted component of type VI protein secretion system
MRSGRLLARGAAVAALLIAATVAFVVVTRSGGGSPASPSQAAVSGVTAHPSATKPAASQKAATPRTKTVKKAAVVKAPVKPVVKPKVHAAIPAPKTTPVAILNGGTAQGAAAALAARLRSLGYPVPVVGNAGRRDLPMAIEYSKGLGPAARALARHVGQVQFVTPLEGPNRNLSGAGLLVILGK